MTGNDGLEARFCPDVPSDISHSDALGTVWNPISSAREYENEHLRIRVPCNWVNAIRVAREALW